MAIQGVSLLPPGVKKEEAIELFKLLSDTNKVIGMLKSEFQHSNVNEYLISIFSLQESVLSTRIEGTQVTFIEMLEPMKKRVSWEMQEVINYQKALSEGVKRINNNEPITTRLIKDMHAILMSNNARGTSSNLGEFRKIQNFIGPDNKIENAVYIPIGANEIDLYMSNLEHYINGVKHGSFINHDEDMYTLDEECDPIIKVAILHAQFESIHPFLDGNGRLGRILIALYAIKENLVNAPIFLVSEELEKERVRYYDLLNGIRGDKPNWYQWLRFFIIASKRMAENLIRKLTKANELSAMGLNRLNIESERTVWLYSFRKPITTVAEATRDLNLTSTTVRKALNSLVAKNLLYRNESLKRNKTYHNYDLIRILDN